MHFRSHFVAREALRLSLASIRRIEPERIVHLGAVPSSGYAALKRLPEELLLQLYLIARQGWIDPRSQAFLLRVDRLEAHAQLTRLANLGLLDECDGIFRIAVHLRGPVGRVLEEKGWAPR